MENCHITMTTAHHKQCQQHQHFATAAGAAATSTFLQWHNPNREYNCNHHIAMVALKTAATCCHCHHQCLCGHLSYRGTTGRYICCKLQVPPIICFNNTWSNLTQLLLIHLCIANNSSWAAAPRTTEGARPNSYVFNIQHSFNSVTVSAAAVLLFSVVAGGLKNL